jgi:pre-mRNA-splicing factor 18
MGAWAAGLAARPPALAASAHGTHATLIHAQTAEYLKPLHRRLKRRTLDAELVAGLSLFVDAADGRNYLAAADVYTRLAIGNAPWPIGVTSVGIHERKAREKISNVAGGGGGGGGAAHIMNDEATRKYLQALKRVLTFLQRARPADPSRCVEFDGGGGDKAALLAASARGDAPLALPPPRALVDGRGEVVVPSKWGAVLRGTDVYREKVREAEEGGGKH